MRARIAGHPLHPALAHFPVGLWLASVLWDAIGWWRAGEPLWGQLSYWCVALGLAAALPTALTGFVELLALGADEPAQATAAAHMMAMLAATGLFGGSWLVRALDGGSAWAVPLALAGAAVLLVGGWLGGTLVYRHGIGR
ncbi:MAG TPA: DUF2231 domain-containing protein [Burkholderiales bacterium]|nr:DUF2231 domain-containing protein [Burkholderiales bacterium]